MHVLIACCGFLGAWLLVAGPVYQAVLELEGEEFEFQRVHAVGEQVPKPPPTSPWWWLLPPVHMWRERRRRNRYRDAVLGELLDDDFFALLQFMNKANGWMLVGVGGFLIAVKETYELVEALEWAVPVMWVLVVVMLALSIGNAVRRSQRDRQLRGTRGGVTKGEMP